MWFRRRKDRSEGHSWFGLHRPFDQKYRAVTSGIVQPWVLFTIRLILAIYAVAASVVHIVIFGTIGDDANYGLYYAYFTRLTWIGLTAYYCAAAFHSGIFVMSIRQLKRGTVSRAPWYPLQKWGRFLQFLHLWLFSTVITMPLLVTIVYWALLASPASFASPFTTWSNVSFHILNTVLLLAELVFGRLRLYWGYLIPCVVVLAAYLGLAYLAHATQGVWVYNFLDPGRPNAKVAAYIIMVLAVEVVVFVIMWGIIHIRDWIWPRGRGVRVVDPHAGRVVA